MNLRVLSFGVALLLLGLPPAVQTSIWAQTVPATPTDTSGRGDLLQPGDLVTLKVWREAEWSGDFPVNEDGIVTLPRIGQTNVTGMSADSLRRFLVDTLGHYLKNPSIEVIPQRRIRVLGSVRNPGLYPVPATVTVGDAVAIAGGATPDGKADQVKLRRDGRELLVDLSWDTRLADTPVRTGDELFVPERSWFSRNGGLVAAGISAATTVVVALLIR